MAATKWPQKPDGPPQKDTMGRTIPWSLEQIWCLEASGGTLWTGPSAANGSAADTQRFPRRFFSTRTPPSSVSR